MNECLSLKRQTPEASGKLEQPDPGLNPEPDPIPAPKGRPGLGGGREDEYGLDTKAVVVIPETSG